MRREEKISIWQGADLPGLLIGPEPSKCYRLQTIQRRRREDFCGEGLQSEISQTW